MGGGGGGIRLRDVGRKKKKKRPWGEKILFIIITYIELRVKTPSRRLDILKLELI